MTSITTDRESEEKIEGDHGFSYSVKRYIDNADDSSRNFTIRSTIADDRGHGKSRKSNPSPKVTKRLYGYFIQQQGEEALVAFVENESLIHYYLPFYDLKKCGIKFENQPFEMDEKEVELDGLTYKRYEFRPLAHKKDKFSVSPESSNEIKNKLDYILSHAPDAQD